MMKRLFSVLLCAVLMSPPLTAAAETAPAVSVDAKACVLMEPITGKVLYESNADEQLAPASVTKVMTVLLVYEAAANGAIKWDDVVTVSDHAAHMGGSQIFLEPYEKQSVRDLTKSVIIASANDAAVALAEFIGGAEESFVDLMNKKAAELGAANTHFQNACGLDADGHYTSARDLALFTRHIMLNYPDVFKYSTVWQDTITHRTKRGDTVFGLTNTNKLLKRYAGATGLKTGSTGKALYCLAGTAKRDGMDLIAVVLGAPTPDVRFNEAAKMLDYGYANYRVSEGLQPGEVVAEIPVRKGDREAVKAAVKERRAVVLPKSGTAEITHAVTLDETVTAPVSVGDKVGVITYYVGGEEAGGTDLVALESADKAGLLYMTKRLTKLWFR